jgi:CRISPR-associated protein Cas2
MMMVVVSYDVNTLTPQGRRRLRRVAKTCQNFGLRVQHSVFECLVDPVQFNTLKNELTDIYEPSLDSLRFYLLGANWKSRVENMGCKVPIDLEGVLLV